MIGWPDYYVARRDSSTDQNSQNLQPLDSVPLSDPVQRMLDLEKSPDFPEQLAKLLDEKDFGNSAQTLRGEHLATLVDRLDGVCPRTTLPCSLLTASPAHWYP